MDRKHSSGPVGLPAEASDSDEQGTSPVAAVEEPAFYDYVLPFVPAACLAELLVGLVHGWKAAEAHPDSVPPFLFLRTLDSGADQALHVLAAVPLSGLSLEPSGLVPHFVCRLGVLFGHHH